jgi:hypothetical protein
VSGTENVAEEILEVVQEGMERHEERERRPAWSGHAALTTLVIGTLAALAATLGGMAANEATMRRVHEAIEVVERRGDRTELAVLESRHLLLEAVGEPLPLGEADRVAVLRAEVESLQEEISDDEDFVERSLETHEVLLGSITLFSVAISLTGMAVLTHRRRLWHISLVLGALGTLVFLWGGVIFFR